MGASRTSNKDVLDAIERLTTAITASLNTPAQARVATPSAQHSPNGEINVDGQYLAHMKSKVADYAKAHGESAVLYARRNGRGETKLAYCVASKWTGLKDRGLIGPVEIIEA